MHNSFVVSLNYNWMDQHKDLGQQGETGRRRSASTKREATRKRVWRVRSTWFIKQRRYNAAPTRVISPFLSFAALWKHSSFFFYFCSKSRPQQNHRLSLSLREFCFALLTRGPFRRSNRSLSLYYLSWPPLLFIYIIIET